MANLLPQLDRELGQNLAQILKKQGVEVLTSAMVQSVEQAAGGLCVHLEQKGKELTVTGEKVLCAIGRRAYFDGLFAAGLTPALNGKRLLVDESYQTSIPGVYAIGDASAAVQLAHVAAAQGTDCVERMCGGKGSIDLNVIPSCIYSAPGNRRSGARRGRGQGAGHSRRVRQVYPVQQRPHHHRRPGTLLHEAGGAHGHARAYRRTAHVPARQRHDLPS